MRKRVHSRILTPGISVLSTVLRSKKTGAVSADSRLVRTGFSEDLSGADLEKTCAVATPPYGIPVVVQPIYGQPSTRKHLIGVSSAGDHRGVPRDGRSKPKGDPAGYSAGAFLIPSVFAITQVTAFVSEDATWHGLLRGMLLLAALLQTRSTGTNFT